ncbi:MAG: diguanylate cyclase [Acidobacteria bacterium]|nr:diguanylate cyclase [Acidobacteriota bacterium]
MRQAAELWTPPDFGALAFGRQGELLSARLRLGAFAIIWLIPLQGLLTQPRDTEAAIGLGAAALGLVVAGIVLWLAGRSPAPRWLGFFTCLFDVSVVSLCNVAFVAAGNPLAATNGRVVFACYFLALALASLRQDARLCVIAGAAAVLQYGGCVLWAASRYDLGALSLVHSTYGTFRWDNQVGRLLLLAAVGAVNAVAVAQSRGYWTSVIRFLDALPVGVLVSDPAGRCELANLAAQRILGRSIPPGTAVAALRSRAFVAGTGEPYPAERGIIARALAGEAAAIDDLEIERQDERIALHAWGAPIFDRFGKVSRVISAFQDRTEERRAQEQLRQATAFLDSIVENIPHMIFVKDAGELRFVRLNRAGEELLGRDRGELIGRSDHDFFPREQADFFTRKDREVLDSGRVLDIPEEPIHTAGQGTRILHTKKIPLLSRQGLPQYLLGISEDITWRKEHEDKSRAAFENSLGYICFHDRAGNLLSINQTAAHALGYSPEELIGRCIRDLLHERARPLFDEYLRRVYADGVASGEMLMRTRSEATRTWRYNNVLYRPGEAAPYVIGHSLDVSELKRLEQELRSANAQLERLADTDGLTHLANRRSFDRQLLAEWSRAARTGDAWLALVLVDVDHFKAFNDRHGHLAGDDCLRQVAAVLADMARRPGDLAARFGGEEFALLLPGTEPAGALGVAEGVRERIAAMAPVEAGAAAMPAVTVSAGVAALVPVLGSQPEQLVDEADKALYVAKETGRNRVVSTLDFKAR